LNSGQDHFLSSRRAAAVRKDLLPEDTPRTTMNEIVKRGHIFFATAIVAVGVPHSLYGRFRLFDGRSFPGETPFAVTPWVPVDPWLAYLTGRVLLLGGFCLIATLRPRTTATLLGLFLFLVTVIVLEASRLIGLGARRTFFETIAICGSALILAETSEPENLHKPNPAADWLIKSGPLLLAFSTIGFGIDHLRYRRFVPSLIPSWISWHQFYSSLAVFAFIAAGQRIGTSQSPSRKRFGCFHQ
jgi:uncharacterized membrane protein YphA (DoxX/SURF4 family)